MLPSTCVVVPTYWTRAGGEPRLRDAVYDHPTAVDGHDTLSDLLESLVALDTSAFYLLVLVAVTAEDVALEAEKRVETILRRYGGITSIMFGASHLPWLHEWMAAHVGEESREYLQLTQYPRIRNLQLALPYALGSDAIVALDDDEVVVDPEFLRKAVEPLGTEQDGKRVDGLSGHYLQEDGGIMLKVDPARSASANLFDRKAAIMNQATEDLQAEDGNLVETPFCFGGNMEFSAELAAAVGFDPGITRGEDIDYLLNARMEGRHFFLRKDLRILHCPPKGGSYKDTTRSKLEQDIIRFIYERTKILASQNDPELQPVTAEELGAYPGEFLGRDISDDACAALKSAGYPDDPEAFVRATQEQSAERVRGYLDFRQRWPAMQAGLRESSEVREWLTSLVLKS